MTTERALGSRLPRAMTDPGVWVLSVLGIVLLATNSGFAQAPVDDALDYRRIAEAAPHLPVKPIASAFTARFAIHYIVGQLHVATGLNLDVAYNLVFAVLLAVLLVAVHLLFRGLPIGEFSLVAALFVFNPYAFRPYLLQTETLQDLVFVFGVAVCLLGLRSRSTAAVILGLAIAVLGRQTAILVAPVAAGWLLNESHWRTIPGGRRPWGQAIAALAVTVLLFVAVRTWSARFSIQFEPTVLHDTVLNLLGGMPDTAVELAAHFARTLIPLMVPLAAFATLCGVLGWRRVPFGAWAALAMCVAIAAQPAMTDPRFPGFAFNEQRLAALALLPLVYAVAVLLDRTDRCKDNRWVPPLLVALLAVGSLHHEFSSIGPQSLAQFLAVQFIVAIVVSGLLIADRRPAGGARTTVHQDRNPLPNLAQGIGNVP
ncbi:hypothetical protein ACNQVK_28150 [Mycobacterium sp. 134]|uniref:hypothetical protein n=1 Tax=Mycobacterium sp. 134 TaxID=3400425 RepID=UPI003AAFF811